MIAIAYHLSVDFLLRLDLVESDSEKDDLWTHEGQKVPLTLIDTREDTFHPPYFFWADFVSWFFIENYQAFLELKIDINQVNLTPCQAHWVF